MKKNKRQKWWICLYINYPTDRGWIHFKTKKKVAEFFKNKENKCVALIRGEYRSMWK